MDLLFCCYRRNDTEDSTPPPGEIRFAQRDNRGPPPDASDDVSAGSDDGQSSDGHQPESFATAAKRTTSTSTTRSGHSIKKTGQTPRINWTDDGESEPESSDTPASVPCANLGTGVLRSSRQGERESGLKKASWTPANNSGKRNLAVIVTILLLSMCATGNDSCFLSKQFPLFYNRVYGSTISSDSTELASFSGVLGRRILSCQIVRWVDCCA